MTFFAYPVEIRRVIYTTNAIESLNSVIRHAIKKRKVFPRDESVNKGGVAGHPVSIPEMDNAASGLADGHEPFYYRVR
jgi:putative transposase